MLNILVVNCEGGILLITGRIILKQITQKFGLSVWVW